MRYMYRNRNSQSKMMFVFSAKNVNQMYRRSRFMKEYATYQKAQGEAVKVKQAQITAKQQEIESNRQEKNIKLREGQTEQQNLERKQAEQKQMVVKLQVTTTRLSLSTQRILRVTRSGLWYIVRSAQVRLPRSCRK